MVLEGGVYFSSDPFINLTISPGFYVKAERERKSVLRFLPE